MEKIKMFTECDTGVVVKKHICATHDEMSVRFDREPVVTFFYPS